MKEKRGYKTSVHTLVETNSLAETLVEILLALIGLLFLYFFNNWKDEEKLKNTKNMKEEKLVSLCSFSLTFYYVWQTLDPLRATDPQQNDW